MKNTVCFFITCLFLYSCKKDKESTEYTNFVLEGTYTSDSIYTIETPIMYIRNGQITNPQIINAYLSRKSAVSFFTNTSTEIYIPKIKLNFDTEGKVIITDENNPLPGSYITKITEKTNAQIILRARDTSFINYNNTSACDIIALAILRPNPTYFCQTFQCFGQTEFPLLIINNNLIIPYVTYLVNNNPPNSLPQGSLECFRVRTNNWSTFNELVLNQLTNNDTIVIQRKFNKLRDN